MGKRELTEALRIITKTGLVDTVYIVDCTVNSYDKTNLTCDCTPIGGDATSDLPGVLLMAENNDGFVVFPSVGSTVKVAFSTRTDPFVMQYSDIDEVQIYIPQTVGPPVMFDIKAGQITFNDGSLGGMVEIANLTTKMNALVSALQAQLALIAIGIGGVGGVYTPGTLPSFIQSDYENPTILNGK